MLIVLGPLRAYSRSSERARCRLRSPSNRRQLADARDPLAWSIDVGASRASPADSRGGARAQVGGRGLLADPVGRARAKGGGSARCGKEASSTRRAARSGELGKTANVQPEPGDGPPRGRRNPESSRNRVTQPPVRVTHPHLRLLPRREPSKKVVPTVPNARVFGTSGDAGLPRSSRRRARHGRITPLAPVRTARRGRSHPLRCLLSSTTLYRASARARVPSRPPTIPPPELPHLARCALPHLLLRFCVHFVFCSHLHLDSSHDLGFLLCPVHPRRSALRPHRTVATHAHAMLALRTVSLVASVLLGKRPRSQRFLGSR